MTIYPDNKKDPLVGGLKGHVGQPAPQQPESHEVLNKNSSVVTVGVNSESTKTLSCAFSEGVSNQTISGLEANLGLEGVLSNCTYHLEGYIGAVEQTCIIR